MKVITYNYALKPPLYSNFALPWQCDIMEYSSIFGSKLEFRVSYKGGSKMDPLLDPLKKGVTKWNPLNES